MRLIALGASNLTRGFPAVVNTARSTWGAALEVYAALGLGRSYGLRSRILARTLPSILESGLWARLAAAPPGPTRALVTDVGNDILYGAETETILSWVAECVRRLRAVGAEIVLTDLPVFSIRRLSKARFLFFRSVLVPACRLSLSQVTDRAEAVSEGLGHLAAAEGLFYTRLRDEWYGFDPIHIRPRYWKPAWQEILGMGMKPGPGTAEPPPHIPAAALYFAAPERRWICGVERRCPQPSLRSRGGTDVWVF
jgi:hypothetical protein